MLEMYYSDKKSETEHPCMNFQSQCWSILAEQTVLILWLKQEKESCLSKNKLGLFWNLAPLVDHEVSIVIDLLFLRRMQVKHLGHFHVRDV